MNSGFSNFLKVLVASLSQPLKLTTLGFGLVFSLALPTGAIIFIPLAFVSLVLMASSDLNNQKFIEKILLPSKNSYDLISTLEYQQKLLRQRLNLVKDTEVSADLVKVNTNLAKSKELLLSLDPSERGTLAFIQDFVPKIVDKVIKLSWQEETARNYLSYNSESSLSKEIQVLQKNKENTTDKISIDEYSKAINLKTEQLDQTKKMATKLDRINSYLSSIHAGLEQTNTYITKVKLKDDNYGFVDESQYLTQSLKQITTDQDDLPT